MNSSGRIRMLQIFLIILGFLLCIQVAGIVTLYEQSSQNTLKYSWKELSDLALLIAGDLDADALSNLKEGEENTTHFWDMIHQLGRMQDEHSAIRFVYTLKKKDGNLAFLTDSEYGRNDFTEPLIGYIYEEAPPEAFDAFDHVTVKKDFYTDPWGTYMSAFAPIKNSANETVAIVGVDFSKEFIDERLADLVNTGFLILIVSTLISIIIFLIILYGLQLTRHYQHEVEENELKIRQILSDVQTGIILTDRDDNTIIFANPEAIRIIGESERDIIGNDADIFICLSENDDKCEGKECGECFIKTRDGKSIPILKKAVTIPYPDKQVIVQSFMDISEQKQAQEALKNLAKDLEKSSDTLADANRKLNMMSSVTRHDIINKITMANGYLSLMEGYIQKPEATPYYNRLVSTISDIKRLIEFTKLYEDLGVQSPVWQDVKTLIEMIPDPVHFISNQVEKIDVYADPLLLKVFENLYDNTLRHGGKVNSITVSYTFEGDTLNLTWEDNGCGITGDQKERIFIRGVGSNTGFGLFIIREILEITGITITEEGNFEEGARFVIHIPPGSYRLR